MLNQETEYACVNRSTWSLVNREKLYVNLVSMLKTIRGNQYILMAKDSFSRYCREYPIPNKEAHTVAKVLMDHLFNVYGLPHQLHSDNGREIVNNLWRELFSLSLRSRTLLLFH